MAKLKPDERWQRHLLERFEAFRLSDELLKLRAEGLRALGRTRLLTTEEYWKLPLGKGPLAYDSSWQKKCETIAERFGLAHWTVKMACLLEGYDPGKQPFPKGAQWPSVRIVTESTDEVFLKHLFHHALFFGIYVDLQQGGSRTAIVFPDSCPVYGPLESSLPDSHRPPREKAFSVELSAPPGYPPEALEELARFAAQLSRELLRCLGYSAVKRLRVSKLLDEGRDLRLQESHLPKRELYEIVAKKWDEGTVNEDEERRKLVKSRRHKLRKRLIKPFQNGRAT
jgi:hypothetical protein